MTVVQRRVLTRRASRCPAGRSEVASRLLRAVAREVWAEASARTHFAVPDVEANRPLLNRLLWYATKGYDTVVIREPPARRPTTVIDLRIVKPHRAIGPYPQPTERSILMRGTCGGLPWNV
jgi:hypothetical protein